MSSILLPRKHLSYSQIDLWQKNKKQYRDRYYLNLGGFENKETIFGKQFAKMMEDGVSTGITDKVPRFSKMEHKLDLKVGGVPFLGYVDSFDPVRCEILEYKTGRQPWDNVRVAKHDQLVIYSLLSKLKYGKVENYTRLVWIETKYGLEEREFDGHKLLGNTEKLDFTGRVEVFKRKIAQWERDKMLEKIVKIADEISEDYQKFLATQ